MGNKVDRPVEERNKILSLFLNDLYNDKVKISKSENEVADITDAVLELVEKIMLELGEINARFKILRIELVGSMKEKTSIGQPDEYDIQVIFESLSLKRGVKLVQVCEDRPGYGHVKITDKDLSDVWADVMEGDELKSTRDQTRYWQKYSLRDEFHNNLLKAVKAVGNKNGHCVKKDSGYLEIYSSSVYKHGPAFTCYLIWCEKANKKLNIDVDIVPALELNDVTHILNDTVSQTFKESLNDHTTLLVVPSAKLSSCKRGLCFKLAFTKAEIELVNSLGEHHKKCYMILKYLYNGLKGKSQGINVFHSYALKTLVLNHAKKCSRREDQETTLAECTQEIIDTTLAYITSITVPHWWYNDFEMNIPCIFLESQSIYEKLIHPRYAVTKAGITKMQKSLEAIGYISEYKYEKCHIKPALVIQAQSTPQSIPSIRG